MQALFCDEFRLHPQLMRRPAERPSPRAGEVLIKVAAAGLGYVDALICAGQYQLRPPLPFTPGSEVAGWVEAVGDGVTSFKTGDRVAALVPSGALAEFALAREALAIKLPASLSLKLAAGAVTNYCTVAYGIAKLGHAAAGETMLVLGAGGGLGMAAIDFARSLGVRSIALGSTQAKREAALSQGADLAVDSTADDWRAEVERQIGKGAVDIVFDPVGGPLSEQAFRLLRPGGRHLVLGFASGEIPKLPTNIALLKRSSLVGVDWGGAVRAEHALFRQQFAPVAEALANGDLRPAALQVVAAEQAGEAMAQLRSRAALGKLIVQMMDSFDD